MDDDDFDRLLHEVGPEDGRARLEGPALWRLFWREQARGIPPALERAARQGFVLHTTQLADVGVSRYEARRNVGKGIWFQPQPKTLAVLNPTGDVGADPNDRFVVERRRHALDCAAAVVANPGHVIADRSAAIVRGLPTISVPESPQLLAPLPKHAHRRGKARLTRDEESGWYGAPVLGAARTVVDVARHDRLDGIVVADAALRDGQVTDESLRRALSRAAGWCGVRGAREVIGLADARAESPLESITRLRLHDDGFPPPRLQVEFLAPGRREPYRVDFFWPEFRLILECDGRVKYREDVRWAEKTREIALSRLGNRVERVVWQDVMRDWLTMSQYLWTLFPAKLRRGLSRV